MEKLRFDMRLRRKGGLEHLIGVVEDFLEKDCSCIRGEGSLILTYSFIRRRHSVRKQALFQRRKGDFHFEKEIMKRRVN